MYAHSHDHPHTLFFLSLVMHSVVFGHAPDALVGLFIPQNSRYFIEDHRFILPYPRLDIYKSSFTYAGVYAWNNLPLQLRSLSSIFSFKKALSVFLHVHK